MTRSSHAPRRRIVYAIAAALSSVTFGTQSAGAAASTLALVVDNGSSKAVIFDFATDTVKGAVPIPNPILAGDCVISKTTAYVSNIGGEIHVIDLKRSTLAKGTNPIVVAAERLDLTLAGKKLLVSSSGGTSAPISAANAKKRTEVDTLDTGDVDNAVQLAPDGSLLTASDFSDVVRRLTIDKAGALTDTGTTLAVTDPNNVIAPPVGNVSLVVTRTSPVLKSFTLPNLTGVATRNLSGGFGLSGVTNAAGTEVYVRTVGNVFGFHLSPGGGLSAPGGFLPTIAVPAAASNTFYGSEQMGLNPQGDKLYVLTDDAVAVYNATTGAFITSITNPDIQEPLGICFPGAA